MLCRIQIETRLLAERMLPIARLPNLLDEIEADQGRESADRLAEAAAAFTAHPAVLERAIRAAGQRADEEAISAYQQRLAIWSGQR